MGFTRLNAVYGTVATQSNSGTTSVVLGTGQGAAFASATVANPVRCVVIDPSTSPETLKFLLDVTGVATDTLTVTNRGVTDGNVAAADANILVGYVIAAVATVGVLNATYMPFGGVFVDSFGAVGDGVADDTAAIVAALATVPAKGTLIFGPKTYLHTGFDITQNGISLRGFGRNLTKLQLKTGTTRESIVYNRSGTGTPFFETIEFIDLAVIGVTGSSHGVVARWCGGPRFVRCLVTLHGGDGVRTFQATRPETSGSEFSFNTGNGWSGGQQNDAGSYRSSTFAHNTGWGAVIGFQAAAESAICHSNEFDGGCVINTNTAGGVLVKYANTVGTKIGGYFEGNTGPHVQIGESGGGQVGPVEISAYLHNGTTAIETWDCGGVNVRGATSIEGVTNGWLMHTRIKWTWDRAHVITASAYAIKDADGSIIGPNGSLDQVDGQALSARTVFSMPNSNSNSFTCPDSALTSPLGDIDIRWCGTAPWNTGSFISLISKYNTGQDAFDFQSNAAAFRLVSSSDGSTARSDVSGAHGLADGAFKWVRVTRASASGQVIFYTSDDGITWTTLTTVAGTAGAIFDSTAPIELGTRAARASGFFPGTCRYAEVRNGIAGPLIAQFDPRRMTRAGTRQPSYFVDACGNTWTNTGSLWDWIAV